MSTPSLSELEERGKARLVLREAYLHDVRSVAVRLIDGFRDGRYVGPSGHGRFLSDFHSEVEGHARVVSPPLIFETISYSESRDEIERAIAPELPQDRGWPEWTRVCHVDDDGEHWERFSMPPWNEIAYHAFAQDVWRAVYDYLNE